ncbi:MAG: 2-oxoacid:acceptor oxidoreductase subunit alpha [Candidatus Nanoarchaeia archaeon]
MIDFAWRVGGEAGYGIATAGDFLAKVCMKHGLNVFGSKEYPSLIRGGHNNFTIRFSDDKLTSQSKYCDLLAALNERTIIEESPELKKGGIIIHDIEVKPNVKGFKLIPVPLRTIASKYGDAKVMMNMVAIGVSCGIIGFDKAVCNDLIKDLFKNKPKFIEPDTKAFNDGYELGVKHQLMTLKKNKVKGDLLINGNDAFCIGALRAGCNFISAYPMTPATSILEFMCAKSKEYGVRAFQVEDEIAAINTALGASFTGARALTCTSGGGFALMNEGFSLAGMIEAPLVIAMSQRPGPATGLPTRTGQGDLLFVLNAGHGEFTRLVLAPGDVNDCYEMALDAFNYADKYQTPVIVLLDKHISDSIVTVKPFSDSYIIDRGKLLTMPKSVEAGHRFKRYEFTKDGVSARPIPGIKGLTYCFAGDEHDQEGFIIESASKAEMIIDKRVRKHELIARELKNGVKVFGEGNTTLVGWGSTKGAIIAAQSLLEKEGVKTQFIQVRVLSPFPHDRLKELIKGQVIVIEDNHDGQLASLLRGVEFKKINKYNGRPLNPEEIVSEVKRCLK